MSTRNMFLFSRNALVLLLLVAFVGPGCISSKRTTYQEETRMRVEFENDTAGRLFYETLSRMKSRRSESETEICLILIESKTTTVTGESVAFNEAVRRCDTNSDGRITETEARIFSEQIK